MADDLNADKAGENGNATDDKSDKAGQQNKAGKSDANGGDQKGENGNKPKPITFESQEDLDDFVKTRLARDRRTRNKTGDEGADDEGDNKDKKSKSKTTDPEKEAALNKARLSDAKDLFIVKTGLEYAAALRIWNIVKNEVEFDGDKPLNLKELDKKMRDEYPEFYPAKVKGKGDGAGGEGKGAAGVSMDDWLRAK